MFVPPAKNKPFVEMAMEHDYPLCALFIDRRKAYHSIPRSSLWTLLPNIIRSLHDGMKFKVRVKGGESGAINVNNGLRQGCTPAPVLFNIFFSEVVSQWQSICRDVGIPVRHRLGRKLVGD